MQVGRANFIMDNLLADSQAKPALVVSCFGHTAIPPLADEGPNGGVLDGPAIENDLLHSIIPLVESEYRVGKQPNDRAILGFSELGAYHALTIGLNNAATFGYVAGLSSLFRANQNLDVIFQPLLAVDASKVPFKLVKVQVGAEEGGAMVASSQNVDRFLTSKGVQHKYVVVPGGIHSWVSWRGYFRDFMTELFQN